MARHHDQKSHERRYASPYGSRNKIPTVQKYREGKEAEKYRLNLGNYDSVRPEASSWSSWLSGYWSSSNPTSPARKGDRKAVQTNTGKSTGSSHVPSSSNQGEDDEDRESRRDGETQPLEDTTQSLNPVNLRTRRKLMQKTSRNPVGRDVTDPVTHLQVPIRDFTNDDFDKVNDEDDSDVQNTSKQRNGPYESSELRNERSDHTNSPDFGDQASFPSFHLSQVKHDLQRAHGRSIVALVLSVGTIAAFNSGLVIWYSMAPSKVQWSFGSQLSFLVGTLLVWLVIISIGAFLHYEWARKRIEDAWERHGWAKSWEMETRSAGEDFESTVWLNMIIRSIWPLVNPALFNGVADTLEDVMQASLPSLVRMVSVDDLGQGSEPLRFLGVRWLPKGAASRTVDQTGQLQAGDESSDDDEEDHQTRESADESPNEVLEAEEGDFINVEISFAYKAGSTSSISRHESRNAHLLLAFYLPGNIRIPIWVELHGFVGVMRARLQLTPDPPFFAMTTVTLMGQPKVTLSCIPLIRKGLNVMDIPLLSNFVQSAIDAAMSQYVAPKSLKLDLKAMLAGDDFKKDTYAVGVLRVKIKRAFDFKEGDTGIPLLKEGKSDAYVSVGWAKFGKPLWSTRVIISEMEPYWEEQTSILVSPEELDADELLRVQLWDSDRFTADDDLGRIEVDLKSLMSRSESKQKMWDRTDPFKALRSGEVMPGRCEWSVGYYPKVDLQDSQMQQQERFPDIQSLDDLRKMVEDRAKRKLREATMNEESEAQQQKQQDLEDTEIELLTSLPPTEKCPAGILGIFVHQIVGLEIETQNRPRDEDAGQLEAAEEDSDTLPSSYCTVILNHQKVYKTRTKPKNSKPYFNASTERYIRDWRTTSLMISVRDARVNENDALLGVVALPIGKLFEKKHTSRINDFYPLVGGIGHGKIRVSIIFRSTNYTPLPHELGWDVGTIVVQPNVTAHADFPSDLQDCHLRFMTNIDKGKMHPAGSSVTSDGKRQGLEVSNGMWTHGYRRRRPLQLALKKRFSTRMMIEFESASSGILSPRKVLAYSILWLSEIEDEMDKTITLPVFDVSKDKQLLKRASQNHLPLALSGVQLGTIELHLKFIRGLGRRHSRVAKRSLDVSNVMEVLTVVKDYDLTIEHLDGVSPTNHDHGSAQSRQNGSGKGRRGEDEHLNDEDDSDSEQGEDDSSSDEGDSTNSDLGTSITEDSRVLPAGRTSTHSPGSTSNDEASFEGRDQESRMDAKANDGSFGGLIASVKSYQNHKEQLHRQQKGVMQWKPARSAKWAKDKAVHLADKIQHKFEHEERQPGIETEV